MKIRFVCTVLLSVAPFCMSFSQNASIDFESVRQWPRLETPLISPNGDYIAYTVSNSINKSTTVYFKSAVGKWAKSFTYQARYFDAVMNDDEVLFSLGKDTVALLRLGKSVEFFAGYRSFKVSKFQKKTFAICSQDTLIVAQGIKRMKFTNVVEYEFVDAAHILLCKSVLRKNILQKELVRINIISGVEKVLWTGNEISNLVVKNSGDYVAFLSNSTSSISDACINIVSLSNDTVVTVRNDSKEFLLTDLVGFNEEANVLIIRIKREWRPMAKDNPENLRIWNYKEEKIQFDDNEGDESKNYFASVDLIKYNIHKLEQDRDSWYLNPEPSQWRAMCLVVQTHGNCSTEEQSWNPACERKLYVVNLLNGSRMEVKALSGKNRQNQYFFSPSGKYILFYDFDIKSICRYSLDDSTIVNLNFGDTYSSEFAYTDSLGYLLPGQRGVAGWSMTSDTVYLYDRHDIWSSDLSKQSDPFCLTNNYGVRNDIVFSLLTERNEQVVIGDSGLVVTAFDLNNKDNGFYRIRKGIPSDPEKLSMGKYIFYNPFNPADHTNGMKPLKALKANKYIVQRQSSKSFPNYYITEDFVSFENISQIHPEKDFKWYSTKLITWYLRDGKKVQGVLYMPQDFDSKKKYPIIFNIYDEFSNGLNAYERPEPLCNSCAINPLQFVSKGYLVFQPDIPYKLNESGASMLNSILGACSQLSKYEWFDKSRLGVQGCSFGGFETNYLITHSELFKAACTASGSSELMGWASMRYRNVYTSFSYQQYRISKPFWEDAKPYFENSPLFFVKNIQTPLLIFHTTDDNTVPFNQAVQLFLTLRRLNKPCWMLEYRGGANHGVTNRIQALDYSAKMQQFFDHYLKGLPEPLWMKSPY